MFLVLTAFQVLQAIILIEAEHVRKYSLKYTSISFVTKHVSLIFGIISFLLLIREIFTAATMNNIAKSNNEYFWYPLVALPQILRVFLYTVLGLIPSSRNGKTVTLPQHNNDSEL
ncbi:hypothetical protein F5877DRAFT_86064 [Lentinula edodes]|nr:hypothetical protein F5877DRAFT_86064 [Lentinula edodes]